MKVVAAYLLAVLGGNTNPSADDLNRILASVGAVADDEKIELLLSQVKGKDLTELIAAGRQVLAAMPSGAVADTATAVGCPSAIAPTASPSPSPSAAAAKDKEEKIEEQSDDDMCFSLFD